MSVIIINFRLVFCLGLLCAGIWSSKAANIVAWGGYSGGSKPGAETNVPPGLTDAIAVSGGFGFTVALRETGQVVAWGNPPFPDRPVLDVPPALNNIVAISCGAEHTVALRSDGTVVGWGFNLRGQANSPPGLRDVVAVSAGGDHNLALRSDGKVVAWGGNTYGATSVPATLSNVVAVRAGYHFSLALQRDGAVVGWGSSEFGAASVPIGLSNVVAISAGNKQGLALRQDGAVILWGRDANNNATPPEGLRLAHFQNVVAIAGSTYHAMGLRADGTLVQYPSDLGPPHRAPQNLSNIIAIATSGSHDMVLVEDRPRVTIRNVGDSVLLSWPLKGEAFALESAAPNGAFGVVSAPAQWNAAAQQFEVRLPLDQPALLFRLRQR